MSWYYGRLPDWMSAYDCPDRYTTEICVVHSGARRYFEVDRKIPREQMIDFAVRLRQELKIAAEVAKKLDPR